MAYNYNKLIGRIVEMCGTRKTFCEKIGLSERSVGLKLSNRISWRQSEIEKACEVLKIDIAEIPIYFFTR